MNRLWIARAFAVCCAIGPGLAAADCAAPGQWMARVGAHNVDPSKTSTTDVGDITVSSKVGLTFNVDYTFCRNFTVDLLAALPFTHDISLDGQKIGSTQHLPPTLTLQYHPLVDSQWDPFVGVGINYTMFFNTSLDIPNASLDLKNTVGYAAQVGVDYKIDKHWRVGVDGRYIQIESDAYVNGTKIGTVDIDPYVYGATLGYAF
jgi:outer membrane protein